MTRTEKLAPVVKHVDKKEQVALQAVAFSQQQLKMQVDRLQQLKEYKMEYANRHSSSQSVSYGSVQFQEFNRFVAQLDDTIKQQQNLIKMAERELDIKRNNWKSTRSRSDAMHKVVDRLQATELKQELKIEQKNMDEVALRNSRKNN